MSASKKFITVWNLYLLWTAVTIILVVVVPLVLGGTSSGGEQKPLIWLFKVVEPVFWGYLLLGVLTTLFFHEWVKEYWYINLLVIGIAAWFLFSL
jgi:hypothetical protein